MDEQESATRKGPWTAEEDVRLTRSVDLHGEGRWNSLAKSAGLMRSGKSCRLRWVNYLRPDIRRGNITCEEERLIVELHTQLGNRWSRIAQRLPGRTDNEIKNYWRTRLKRKAPEGNDNQCFLQRQMCSSPGLNDDVAMFRRKIETRVQEANTAASTWVIRPNEDDVDTERRSHLEDPLSDFLEQSNPTEQSANAVTDEMADHHNFGFQLPGQMIYSDASYGYLCANGDRSASTILEGMEGFDQLLMNGTSPREVSAPSEVDSLTATLSEFYGDAGRALPPTYGGSLVSASSPVTDSRNEFSNEETSFWHYDVSDVLWNLDDYHRNMTIP